MSLPPDDSFEIDRAATMTTIRVAEEMKSAMGHPEVARAGVNHDTV